MRQELTTLLTTFCIAAASVALLPALPAAAQQAGDPPRQYILLSGTDIGSHSTYSWLGVITPLTGQFQGNDWILRGWGDFLTYETEDSLGDLNARVASGSITIARNFSDVLGGTVSLGAGGSIATRWYDRDNTQDDEGAFARFRVEGSYFGEPIAEDHHINLLWSVSVPETAAYVSGDYLVQLDTMKLGPTASWSVGEDYSIIRAGMAAREIPLTDTLGLSLAGGYENSEEGHGAFGSVGLTLSLGFE